MQKSTGTGLDSSSVRTLGHRGQSGTVMGLVLGSAMKLSIHFALLLPLRECLSPHWAAWA